MIPLSVLDLAPIVEGSDATRAFRNSLDLAQHAERWGYRRFWLAEHHSMPGVGSAATSVLIAHIAGGTTNIRVGAGGIMLPNHAPMVIAEQFGTLEALFPGRIDLGLGRAPGSDQETARALRRHPSAADNFPHDVMELMSWFREPETGQVVRAIPAAGLRVPIWILGSSLFGAQLAAALGLPFAFASHFAPAQMMEALALYRSGFQRSEQLEKPYVMLGINVFAADTDEEGRYLFTSLQQAFVALRRGQPRQLPLPVENVEEQMHPADRVLLAEMLHNTFVGSPETVRRGIDDFVQRTGADELMITSQIHGHERRLESYTIVAREMGLRARDGMEGEQ